MAREANSTEIQLVFPQADLVQGSAWTSEVTIKGQYIRHYIFRREITMDPSWWWWQLEVVPAILEEEKTKESKIRTECSKDRMKDKDNVIYGLNMIRPCSRMGGSQIRVAAQLSHLCCLHNGKQCLIPAPGICAFSPRKHWYLGSWTVRCENSTKSKYKPF